MAETTSKPAQSLATKVRHQPLTALREEFDDLLSRFTGGIDDGWFGMRLSPLADVSETDACVEVSMDLPGVNPDEIDIRLAGNVLTVRGERKEEKEEKGREFHRVERRRGSFSRSITLPCAVVEDEVAAEYKDGVLTMSLPKCEEAKSRKIKVKH
jgi:HSP20 family protein